MTPLTASHRGGSGSPLICLHGFLDTWRTWELVLPELERHHDVLALTLAGHAGGPPLTGPVDGNTLADAVERAMDAAGFELAHLVGNSLGGHVALQLAARGRARTVVALAPAGGWAADASSRHDVLEFQADLIAQARQAAPNAAVTLASLHGRRMATRNLTTNYEHIPTELLVHQALALANCSAATALLAYAADADWTLDAEHLTCPVRVVWGTADRLLPWPAAATRYLHDWLPNADWILLDDVGHCPQLDVPLETVQLILGLTSV